MASAMYYIFWELNTNFTKIECLEERHQRKEIEKKITYNSKKTLGKKILLYILYC